MMLQNTSTWIIPNSPCWSFPTVRGVRKHRNTNDRIQMVWKRSEGGHILVHQSPKPRGGGGGFSVNFRRYARLGKKFMTLCPYIFAWKCTHFTEMYKKFRPKMHPSVWNEQKILLKIVPICMPYVRQILFKDTPFFFLKSTECWVVRCYELWSNFQEIEMLNCAHSDEIYKTWRFSVRRVVTWIVPFLHGTIYLHHKSSSCGVNLKCLHVF